MQEKQGQYFEKGAVIFVVEDVSDPDIEIALSEDDENRVQPGQIVTLKARALPFQTFEACVDRKAPSAVAAEGHAATATVTAYCHLQNADPGLLPGMTGYARVSCGLRSPGMLLLARGMQFLRTEFWW